MAVPTRDRQARTTSLARSIVWSSWWRRLLSYLLLDIVLVGVLVGGFACEGVRLARAQGLSSGTLAITHARQVQDRLAFEARRENGEVVSFVFGDYVEPFLPLLAVVAAGEAIGLTFLPFSTRRVRRKLQPLNDLAVAAEELSHATTVDANKFESLEQAIHMASVESPHVSTGDKDLRSIEVALNGLLRQMQDAKLQQVRFVSDASHELRTPIQVIQGYVNMLDRWGKSDEAVLEESIAALKAESQHMQDLVEQLLFLARGDSGKNELVRECVDVTHLLHEVVEESKMIDASHVYVLRETGDDAIEVVGDAAMIKQCLRILTSNACSYAPEGTEIALWATRHGGEVALCVQDEGIGMSQTDASHVFERFYRADEARDRREGGTGLGLSIAKWIVDAHEGRIEVLSREGVGTRFTITLPA